MFNEEENCNPFKGWSPERYAEARATMVYAILGTDMKFHFDHMSKFKTRYSAGAYESPSRTDVRLLLAMCLHAADVSNPTKHWRLATEWTVRGMEEFFRQGEKEAELGLPISPFMDRNKTDIAQCQAGFVSVLIKPFFDEWTTFLGDLGDESAPEHSSRIIYTNVVQNIEQWKSEGEAALKGREKFLHTVPAEQPADWLLLRPPMDSIREEGARGAPAPAPAAEVMQEL